MSHLVRLARKGAYAVEATDVSNFHVFSPRNAFAKPIAVLPVLPVAFVGVVALVVSPLAALRERDPDLVVDPTGSSAGSARVARLASVWLMPALTVLMCLLAAVTWALT